MKPALIEKGIPALFALLGIALLGRWVHGYLRASAYTERPLGLERPVPAAPAAATTLLASPPLPGSAASAVVSPTTPAVTAAARGPFVELPGAWPRFRGPNGDNVSPETTPLARTWDAPGPPVLWAQPMGEGYAGAAVSGGRVYVLDYDQAAQADTLRCFSLADGGELWRQSYRVTVKRNHGMSRTIPAVSGKYVVTLGPKCHAMCADRLSGKVYWLKDLTREFGATVPEWYAGQCPLIEDGKAIFATGGQALMVAIDCATGKVAWKTPNPRNWEMTHSSIAPMTLNGKRMYVWCGSGGVAGVSAKDGALLWDTEEWTINTATVPTPVPVGEGRVFLTGGYNAGSMMLQVTEAGGKYGVQTLFRLPASVFGSDQQTPILYKGYLYGVIPGGQLACMDLSGKPVWTSGSTHRFGMGGYALAGGLLYVLNDGGLLTMVEASPTGFKPLAQAQVLEGPEAWGPPAIAGGRLLVRDLTRMVCLDIGRR